MEEVIVFYRKRKADSNDDVSLYGFFGTDGDYETKKRSVSSGVNMMRIDQNRKDEQGVGFFERSNEIELGKDVGVFEKHTKGIGMKLLQKMGYRGGGLGKNAQGIVSPIQPKLRPKNLGIGFNKEPVDLQKPIKVFPDKDKSRSCLKQGVSKRKEKEYVMVTKQEHVVLKVFDMRGPQVRVLTNLMNLNEEEEGKSSPMPELAHNIRLIVDVARFDKQKFEWDLENERDTVVTLQKEKRKLEDDATLFGKQLHNMEEIESVVECLTNESLLGSLTLESVAMSFGDLQRRYPDEYRLYDLPVIASSFALPLLITVFQGWDPLKKPSHGLNIMSVLKHLLQGDEISNSHYTQLFLDAVFPVVRICATNTAQATDPEPLLRFLDCWEQLIPYCALQTILDNIVMPKLASAVDAWDPRSEIPIHSWVHPWLPLLGHKLDTLHHTIQKRLESLLHDWHPSDMSAYDILSPWKNVFDPTSWEQMMVRYIVPKLSEVMLEFEVNPADQKLDQFYWVRTWVNVIPTRHMLCIMDVFFNKWLQVLYIWLCSKPNFEQVRNWYLGWKNVIPPELLSHEHVTYWLRMGLEMMNQAAQGLKIVHPGLRENIKRQIEAQAEKGEQRGFGSFGTDDGVGMSLKEVIEVHAQYNDLVFKPKVARMKDGYGVYGFGRLV